jgi:hypothetical protein
MIGFAVLGAIGVLIFIECACIQVASQKAYKRGFDEGHEAGKIEAEVWWLEQGAEVQRAREQIWREQAEPKGEN